jgi:hypothetical protein
MKSLADFPDLYAQLHPDNDSGLKLAKIGYGIIKKLLWRCPVADDHVWQALVKECAVAGNS